MEMRALKELYLDENPLKVLPLELGFHQTLGLLSVRSCPLVVPPVTTGAEDNAQSQTTMILLFLRSLKRLRVSGRLDISGIGLRQLSSEKFEECLQSVCSQLAGWGKVLSDSTEQMELVTWHQIQSLDLSKNRLETLPSCITAMKALKHFSAAGNRLTLFPCSIIQGLPRLESADLRGNSFPLPKATNVGGIQTVEQLRAYAVILANAPMSHSLDLRGFSLNAVRCFRLSM